MRLLSLFYLLKSRNTRQTSVFRSVFRTVSNINEALMLSLDKYSFFRLEIGKLVKRITGAEHLRRALDFSD